MTSEGRPVRLGFVGAGGRTVRELLDLVQVPGAEISALCDIDQARCDDAVDRTRKRTEQGGDAAAIERARSMKPKTYSDVKAMLEGSELDAVYVSLPPFAHGARDPGPRAESQRHHECGLPVPLLIGDRRR